jgi:phage gp37-like protein
MKPSPGDNVRVVDDNGGEWPGRVIRVHSDAVEVEYAGWAEVFRLPDGRRGSRYIREGQEAGA